MSKKVLITGAAGFIGSHLAEECLSLGLTVTGVDGFTDYYSEVDKRRNLAAAMEHPNFTLVEDDLLSLDVNRLLSGTSIVFHLAAQPGVRASWDSFSLYTRQNLDVTQRLLHAARNLPLERFVLASSSSIYGNAEAAPTREDIPPSPVSPYGVTKLAAEQLATIYWRTFGVPTVALRYFTVYGPRQRPDMAFHRLIRCALSAKTFSVFGDGFQTRDFTFVTDVVRATVSAGYRGAPGSIYNIGGGSRRSLMEVIASLGQLLGTPVLRSHLEPQAGDARDTCADTTAAKRDLGFAPSFGFDHGLAAQLEWHQNTVATPVPPSDVTSTRPATDG